MGIERVRAVKFGNLTEMAEIVVGEFVEHLRQGDGTEFGVTPGPRRRGSGNRMEVENKGNKLLDSPRLLVYS